MSQGFSLEQAWKAAKELGIGKVGQYALYQIGMKTGHYRRTLQASLQNPYLPKDIQTIFKPAQSDLLAEILYHASFSDADLVMEGKYRPYGGDIQDINLSAPGAVVDWTKWRPPAEDQDLDIKDIWEPARFGWAMALVRAYRADGNDAYASKFWQYYETFQENNPPYNGPNWLSGQEAAIRLIHLVICGCEFRLAPSSSIERIRKLAACIADHANRIPPTMAYARAQRNNHLLSEAAGLFTAGSCLPDHPRAGEWRETGWREFEKAILNQIDVDGTYVQQSVCYHRLMLTLALWMNAIRGDRQFSGEVLTRLQSANCWLHELMAGLDGSVPNLGSNDGSWLIPLTDTSLSGYLEAVKACKSAFLGYPVDSQSELSAWLAYPGIPGNTTCETIKNLNVRRMDGERSVGFFRTVRFTSRPSHADQLHFDLWWQEQNLLCDAGTYRYNAPLPWDNRLSGSDVHNVVTVDGLDQMTRVGKFLWQDWAQTEVLQEVSEPSGFPRRISARMDRYRNLKITSTRTIELHDHDYWIISDHLEPDQKDNSAHQYRLHWLLPDASPLPDGEDICVKRDGWFYQLSQDQIRLATPAGLMEMTIRTAGHDNQPEWCIYRAGEMMLGSQTPQPTWGWFSPTYGVKEPALSLAVYLKTPGIVSFVTSIHLIPWEVSAEENA